MREDIEELLKDESILTKNLEENPEDPELLLAKAVLKQKRKEDAREELLKVIQLAYKKDNLMPGLVAATILGDEGTEKRIELYLKLGMGKRALEFLIEKLEEADNRNDQKEIKKFGKKIAEIGGESLDLLLQIAKIFRRYGFKKDARLMVENVIYKLQGREKYNDALKIRKEYEEFLSER